jgi:hypothetical protein
LIAVYLKERIGTHEQRLRAALEERHESRSNLQGLCVGPHAPGEAAQAAGGLPIFEAAATQSDARI